MESTTSTAPSYFDVFRQFGKHGFDISDARFAYNGRGCESQPQSPAQMLDIWSVPYSMLTRFIQLIPSAELRRLSFSNKYFYGKCLETRGIEVQIIYLTYNVFGIVPKRYPLKNGRLVVELQPYLKINHEMLPYFRTVALFVDSRRYYPDHPMHDTIVKNYSQFYGLISSDNDWPVHQPFLHDKLDSAEFKIYTDDDVNVFELIPKLRQIEIKIKTFSFYFFALLSDSAIDQIGRLLIKNKPKCDHFYFCYCPAYNRPFNQCDISVYDDKTSQFKSHYSSTLNERKEFLSEYQGKLGECEKAVEKEVVKSFFLYFQGTSHLLF